MKNKKKYIMLTMSILLVLTVMLIGFTFAYYRTRIVGNNSEKPSIDVTSKKLEVVYSDDQSTITADSIDLGWSATKTFSVENTGDDVVNYNVILDNVENEFELEGWFYDLEQVLSDGDTEFITPGVISRDEYQLVEGNIAINPGETHNYIMNFYYQDTDMDQSDDMGKSMSLRVNIEETVQIPSGPTIPENVTITYISMFPNTTNVPVSETIKYMTDYTLSSAIPERGELYTFIGWNMNSSCDENSSATMPAGSIVQNIQTDITLYACWSVQTG